MRNVVYSLEAEQDLEDIVEYIAKTSVGNAVSYLERYEKRIALLQDNPKLGTLCINKQINKECRVLSSESHIVIYQENESEVLIVRIFHQSVNYPKKV